MAYDIQAKALGGIQLLTTDGGDDENEDDGQAETEQDIWLEPGLFFLLATDGQRSASLGQCKI